MQNQFGIQFEILNSQSESNSQSNSQSNSYYSNEFEDEKQVVEIEDSKDDPFKNTYSIYHNDKIKYTVESKNEALQIVDNEINHITNYYSNIDSVYKINVSVQNDTYNIYAHYEFQNIVVSTIFETFKIVKTTN